MAEIVDDSAVELLFFETFSHLINEDLNLDLVQFPKPVYITEVRIIPLGARVHGDFKGGIRLGATTPSKFHVEFFVNDLGKPDASTFECLGDFEYNQNECINLDCLIKDVRQIPTDGLVLRGWYTTITLAVYGTLTKGITEQLIETSPPAVIVDIQPIPVTPAAVCIQITTNEKTEPNWPPVVEELYVEPTAYTAVEPSFEPAAQPQPYASQQASTSASYYADDGGPKEVRKYRARSRGASSESDWDRDEMEEARRSGATSPPPPPPPRELSRTRDSRVYSRSSSRERERDYVGGGRSKPRSPGEYRRSSRHTKVSSYDRKRDKSREHDRKTPDNDKRPRTPPILSPRRPRTPDRSSATSPIPLDSHDKRKYFERGQPIRVIDTVEEQRTKQQVVTIKSPSTAETADTTIASPTAAGGLIEDEIASPQPEPFEPILSDEEINDEAEAPFELDYDVDGDWDEFYKPYSPIDGTPLEKFNANYSHELKLDMAVKLLQKYKVRADEPISVKHFESLPADAKENWVDSAENLIQILQLIHNFNFVKRNAILDHLLCEHSEILSNWLKLGLNFDCAIDQPQPGYKIRHIKIGARLSELLGCCSGFIETLLHRDQFNIFDKLFDMYYQKTMALSIKLMLIKAMYSCLDTKIGVTYFLDHVADDTKTGYQRLITALQENPLTRIKFALKSVMKKINLYESLQLIHEIVAKLFIIDNNLMEHSVENDESNLQLLHLSLNEVYKAFTLDSNSYSQPKRFLPVTAKFENVKDLSSLKGTAAAFQSYFTIHALLETILLLMSNQNTLPQNIYEKCIDFVIALTQQSFGLDYLYSNIETTNVLVKCLLQSTVETLDEAEEDGNLVEEIDEISNSDNYRLGLEISIKIKTKHCLDTIQQGLKNDLSELTETLHALYDLSSNPMYRSHVIDIIAIDSNIIILLTLVDKEKKAELLRHTVAAGGGANLATANYKLKSPIIGYAIDVIDICVRYCGRLEYLQDHGSILLNLVKSYDLFETSISIVLQEMAIYLKPLEIPNVFSYEDIQPLCEVLKRSIEFITTFPGDLITALRIVRHMAIAPEEHGGIDDASCDEHIELNYEYYTLQFYSADGVTTLVSILDKLNNYFEQPGLHVAALASNQGVLLTHILLPTLQILRKMLTLCIQCRNTQFKDLTSVEHLLKTYTLMYNVRSTSAAATESFRVQEEIIKLLLAFTQPTPVDGVDTESVHKSLWTQMIGDIIKYILTGPFTYISGLMAFCELLPITLPIQTLKPLQDNEVQRLVTERQLWSAHLHPKSTNLSELIQTIATSTYPPLLHVLSRLCLQLADLAPNMSIIVSKSIVDLMLNEPSHTPTQSVCLLNFLADLCEYAQIKVSILSILTGKFYDYLINILTTALNGVARLQTSALRIFKSLLDVNVNICQLDSQQLSFACALPAKDILPGIVNAIYENFLLNESVAVLEVMNILTRYDFTFYLLKSVMEKKKEQFLQTIEKLTASFATNVNLLKIFFDFLQNLSKSNDASVDFRTIFLNANDLDVLLSWTTIKSAADDKTHPFVALQKNLDVKEEDNEAAKDVGELLVQVNDLLQFLDDKSGADGQEIAEPMYPAAEGIVVQYSARQIYQLCDQFDDDQLQADFLQCPNELFGADELNDSHKISCDLSELVKTCLPADTNITSECKRLLHLSASPQSNRERTTTAPCFRTQRVEVEPTTGRPEKKIYVTRGRGFPRTPPTRGDLFRSRPPNTSRPPSLHVDDFVALETCGAQPTGPTGYNKMSREIISIRGTRGGRGRGGFASERGGFISDRGGRLSTIGGSGTPTGSVYRQSNRRTNSPSTWHNNGSMEGGPQQKHFRTATSEPVVSSHYQSEFVQTHFSGQSTRGRMRGGTRPPRSFNR